MEVLHTQLQPDASETNEVNVALAEATQIHVQNVFDCVVVRSVVPGPFCVSLFSYIILFIFWGSQRYGGRGNI